MVYSRTRVDSRVRTIELALQTKGHTDIPDLTDEAACAVGASGLKEGQGTVFAPSSTSGLRPLEYKPGAVADLKRAPDEMAPANRE